MTFRPILILSLASLVAAAASLSGCVPLVVGAAVGGTALVATDRRSVGAQADDESIELKIGNVRNSRWGDQVHVNVTSYNGIVLLSGEVPDAKIKADMEEIARTTNPVKRVYDEVEVRPVTTLSERTNDTYITSKVKARFVEQTAFSATHVKVVTERGVVYLMGLVRKDEGDAAARIASTTSGVVRVVKLFETI
ncbi:MAG TPA: BON domain-containing protein [Casimicrobiaceae bacterium]|nr:BON domain-containing protein [Casimicrobiaceae bacterium]